MNALITSSKFHTRCSVSVGGINTSLAWWRFESTQTCSLLIAIVHSPPRKPNTLLLVTFIPCINYTVGLQTLLFAFALILQTSLLCLSNKTISQHSCESSWREKSCFRRSLVIRVGSCSRSINTTVSFFFSFFFFFWQGKCSPATGWTNTPLFPVCVLPSLQIVNSQSFDSEVIKKKKRVEQRDTEREKSLHDAAV